MISFSQFTRSIVISIAASCLLPIAANAKDFKVGEVNKLLQTDYICSTSFPNKKGLMVLVDLGSKTAWINIDGSNIGLKQTSSQLIKSNKRAITKYRKNNIILTVDSKHIRTIEGELNSDENLDTVTFKIGNQSKTIQAKGSCIY
jgi:hypothetical protein